jgi:hypothetical protein
MLGTRCGYGESPWLASIASFDSLLISPQATDKLVNALQFQAWQTIQVKMNEVQG